MSSGIVNNLLQDSLAHLQAQSAAVLNELAELQIHNGTSILLPPSSLNEAEYSPDLADFTGEVDIQKLETIQQSFSDISALVLNLSSQGSTAKTNDKLLSLKKLTAVLKPFEDGSIASSITFVDPITLEVTKKLEHLIALYGLVALYQITLTHLLKSTLPLSNDLVYWELTSSSSRRIVLYSLQTLPIRCKRLLENVWKEFIDTASPDVNSLDVHVPQYITTNYPTYQSTYKLFVHYERLLTNSLYNNIIANNIKGFYKFVGSRKNYGVSTLGRGKVNSPNVLSYVKVMLGAPFTSVVQELEAKRSDAKKLQDENAQKLGSLLLNVPNISEITDESKVRESLENLLHTFSIEELSNDSTRALYKTSSELLPQLLAKFKSQGLPIKKPSLLIRYWPTLLTLLLYGPAAITSAITNKDIIVEFIKKNVVETMAGFWKNWIIKPVNNILSTIRHDDSSEISIMSQNSLDSDLESLKRMVIEYTVENSTEFHNLKSTDVELLKQELNAMVSSGDMTPMMKSYEQDIKKPLKNIVSGRLPRALLIQLQKTKVDGAVAISGIDKLLKSQELVFGIVAASPSLLILVYLLNGVNAYLRKGYFSRSSSENKLIASKNLNNVERLLGSLEDIEGGKRLDYVNGMLLLEMISLRNAGLLLVPANRRLEWVRDINDLVNSKATTNSRLNTVERIYHVYGGFLV